uniref:Uncharacterized protein n=1 Tax=Leersia perrieri TaxID=77586 RepID=A0A0D9WXG2_9ORYZ
MTATVTTMTTTAAEQARGMVGAATEANALTAVCGVMARYCPKKKREGALLVSVDEEPELL